jgi:hypothetical protein
MRFRHCRWFAVSLPLTLVLLALIPRRAGPDSAEILPANDSPLAATSRLLMSYRLERIEDYAALLLPDFRFFFGDAELQAAHPDGFTREDEIESARHLFEGFTDASGIQRPAAWAIETGLDVLRVGDEPGRPAAQYQVVTVCGMRLRIDLESGDELLVGPACHEFHFERGDVAARGPDQPGDTGQWYLRSWVESPPCDAACSADAIASRAPPASDARDAGPPVILRTPNPARGAVSIWMRLPGSEPATLHLFDLAGRRVLEREFGGPFGSESRMELAEAATLPPGIYWLRLTQGTRVGPARAVVLR